MAGDLFDEQGAHEDQEDAHKIHQRTHPGSIGKEYAGKEGDNGNLSSARHPCRQHCGGSSFPLIPESYGRP